MTCRINIAYQSRATLCQIQQNLNAKTAKFAKGKGKEMLDARCKARARQSRRARSDAPYWTGLLELCFQPFVCFDNHRNQVGVSLKVDVESLWVALL